LRFLEHQFARNKVDKIAGVARFVDSHTIAVTDKHWRRRARHLRSLRACGRHRALPSGGRSVRRREVILDPDDILSLKRLPRSLAVIGAGVIGIEYATIFSALRRQGHGDRAAGDSAAVCRSRARR